MHEGDDELTLFWRAVQDSAEVYAELLARWARGARPGQIQGERGRLYQVRDRTWASEQRLARQLRENPLPELPLRVRWFLMESPDDL